VVELQAFGLRAAGGDGPIVDSVVAVGIVGVDSPPALDPEHPAPAVVAGSSLRLSRRQGGEGGEEEEDKGETHGEVELS